MPGSTRCCLAIKDAQGIAVPSIRDFRNQSRNHQPKGKTQKQMKMQITNYIRAGWRCANPGLCSTTPLGLESSAMFQPILSLMDRAPTNPGNFRKALRLKPAFRHRFAWGGEFDAALAGRRAIFEDWSPWAANSPSPRPSPRGRGRILRRQPANPRTEEISKAARWFSLSWERGSG